MIRHVGLPDAVRKQLRRLPEHIVVKLLGWAAAVRRDGLEETRKIPGFHDEPIRGSAGRRSIRLSRAYRAYYRVFKQLDGLGMVEIVRVEGVDKHRYRR